LGVGGGAASPIIIIDAVIIGVTAATLVFVLATVVGCRVDMVRALEN
jgi:hypothetical protein